MVTLDDLHAAFKAVMKQVLGGGSDISAANPLFIEDTNQVGYTWERFLNEGLDAHWIGRKRALDTTESAAKPSDYWTISNYAPPFTGGISCPRTLMAIALYSRKIVKYGTAVIRTVLPTLVGNQTFGWGFEHSSGFIDGIVALKWELAAGVPTLYATHGSLGVRSFYNLTAALPVDYNTVEHYYSVKISKNMIEWYIDRTIVCVAPNSPNLAFTDVVYPPYHIGRPTTECPPYQSMFLETHSEGVDSFTMPLSPYNVRLVDGDPIPPRIYRLYDAGTTTLFAGLAIAAGSETSHPFPVFGYSGKSINFRASEQGTLSVQVLKQTNNWREYDTMGITKDKLNTYSIDDEAVLARIVFTPNTYPCTISEAEVALR